VIDPDEIRAEVTLQMAVIEAQPASQVVGAGSEAASNFPKAYQVPCNPCGRLALGLSLGKSR
jgi:hypothetical protein